MVIWNRTVGSFNYVYLQNGFTNPVIDIYVRTELGTK